MLQNLPDFSPSLIYPIEAPRLRQDTRWLLGMDNYVVKAEFHITYGNSEYVASLSPHQLQTLSAIALEKFPVHFTQPLYAISKDKVVQGQVYARDSIVTPVNVDGLYERVKHVTDKLGIQPPSFFPHVTIATRPFTPVAQRGIGITSEEEWKELQPKIFTEDWLEDNNVHIS